MLAQTENTPRGATLPRRPRIPNLSGMLWRSPAAKRRPPGYIESCIPALAAKLPAGPQWDHEIKHDGYRLAA
jgi:hypothetical protein